MLTRACYCVKGQIVDTTGLTTKYVLCWWFGWRQDSEAVTRSQECGGVLEQFQTNLTQKWVNSHDKKLRMSWEDEEEMQEDTDRLCQSRKGLSLKMILKTKKQVNMWPHLKGQAFCKDTHRQQHSISLNLLYLQHSNHQLVNRHGYQAGTKKVYTHMPETKAGQLDRVQDRYSNADNTCLLVNIKTHETGISSWSQES